MGKVDYRDGIAILQLIVFPVLLVAALSIWRKTGWRAGGKSWRFVVTLSLLRIAGGICTLLTMVSYNENIFIAEAVCELIGIAPLILAYIGLIGQIDIEHAIPPRIIRLTTLAGFIGLIIGIVGVSITNRNNNGPYHPNGEVKAAMGVFLAVFAITTVMMVRVAFYYLRVMKTWQKKLLLAVFLSWPFLLVRLVYSALGDFTTKADYSIFGGNTTIYLCMDVLMEIIAMGICVAFGLSAMPDLTSKQISAEEVDYNRRGDHV